MPEQPDSQSPPPTRVREVLVYRRCDLTGDEDLSVWSLNPSSDTDRFVSHGQNIEEAVKIIQDLVGRGFSIVVAGIGLELHDIPLHDDEADTFPCRGISFHALSRLREAIPKERISFSKAA
ncbi:MAG: hypothetical protein PHZ00_04980 [Candidatus Peribacteraceae bacterium]|nr:hypothetical protein [Candidatus Peribacteraceae bacterium]